MSFITLHLEKYMNVLGMTGLCQAMCRVDVLNLT